jgi:tungstate transport system substrate-binding protein
MTAFHVRRDKAALSSGCKAHPAIALRKLPLLFFLVLLGRVAVAAEQPAPQSIILASTTSVENSGLLVHILPTFTKETGITVHVLA